MLKKLIRPILRPSLLLLCKLFYRVEVESANPDFNAERLVIVSNHESLLDGLLLGLFLPIEPVFVVNTQIAGFSLFRFFLSMVDYVTVDPVNPMSTRHVVHLIESGRPVVVFPEGRITVTGSLMKVYEGTAFVVGKTNANIIPVRLEGPARSRFSRMTGSAPRRWFPKMRISILPCAKLPESHLLTAKQRRHEMAEHMRHMMQEMIFLTKAPSTLFDSLLEASRIYGRGRKIVEDIKLTEYSYGDLLKMSLMLGRLVSRYDNAEARIGLLLPNLAPTLALLIGLTAYRRTPALLNFTAGTEGMQNACIAAKISTIVTSRAFLEQGKLVEKVDALQDTRVIYLEDLRAQVTLRDKLWWLAYARWCPYGVSRHGAQPEDTAVVLFTSGTEGKPKGVALSHRAILANIAQVRAIYDISTEDKFLNALPLFHSFGLTAGTLLPVLTGARLFLYPSPLHYRAIPELAYERGCTVLFGTSTFLGHYGKFAHPYDFYRLRYVIAGAEKLSKEVRELWFEKFGVRIFEGYGATETAPVLAVNTPMAFKSGTVGQLLPGIRHRLVPVPGIAHGGILHVSGPNVMSGYYRFEHPGELEHPSSSVGPGWYDTGDVVDIDHEGFVHVLGRVKRFAKVAGEMISLEIAENIAAAASKDKLHAVVTQPDPLRGEMLVLCTTDREMTREKLHTAAKMLGQTELAIPRKIVVMDHLPLLASGKTDYVTLEQLQTPS